MIFWVLIQRKKVELAEGYLLSLLLLRLPGHLRPRVDIALSQCNMLRSAVLKHVSLIFCNQCDLVLFELQTEAVIMRTRRAIAMATQR